MSYDINVLVNGNRCKQYLHKGRTYIEAKEGSEYVVEIKNNSWEKVLAVVSVDGLNVVDGKTADENGPGYVMDKYTAQRLYGFQYSPEKVATFKFGAFGEKDSQGNPLGYAASKGDGSEKNAGIIGVRIWDEVPKPQPPPAPLPVWTNYSITSSWSGHGTFAVSCSYSSQSSPNIGGMPTIIRSATSYSPNPQDWNAGGLYGAGRFGYTPVDDTSNINSKTGQPYSSLFGGCAGTAVNTVTSTGLNSNLLSEAIADAKAVRATACANAKSALDEAFQDHSVMFCASADSMVDETDKASFDMETQWGASRTYKVKEVEFERREVVHNFDLYYASRESLILMGVDLGTEKRVSFPESFKEDKYAKPPKGWRA